MTKTRRNRFLALALALVMVFALAACSASSSSTTTTTFSTSKTDENGNTTTNTTTSEVGVSVGTDGISTTHQTNTQTTTDSEDGEEDPDPEEEAAELTKAMNELYTGGSMGTNSYGDTVYFAWNDDNDNLMLAVKDVDLESFSKWHGYSDETDDGQPVLTGYSEDKYIPYEIEMDEGAEDFTLRFLENGIEVEMQVMDYEEFVTTFVNDWVSFD